MDEFYLSYLLSELCCFEVEQVCIQDRIITSGLVLKMWP